MKRFVQTTIAMALIYLVFFSILVFSNASGQGSVGAQNRIKTPFAPIKINNNTELQEMAQNEGWEGSGTTNDPYIIQDYEIDAHGGGYGIFIGNTTLILKIYNVTIYNATYHSMPYNSGGGVVLYNVHDVSVGHSVIHHCNYGVYVRGGGWSSVISNKIRNNTYGIYIYSATYMWIAGNNISYNRGGIGESSSYSTTIYHNDIYKNGANHGISITSSLKGDFIDSNRIMFTTGNGDGIHISGSSISQQIDGIEIRYNEIYNNSGQGIYIAYTNGTWIHYNSIHNNTYSGIYMYSGVYNTTIENNTISGNTKNGVDVYPYTTYDVEHTTIKYNNISFNYIGVNMERNSYDGRIFNNTGLGVDLSNTANDIWVYNNSFYYNNGATDTYDATHIQAHDAGSHNRWNTTYGNFWYDWANNNDTNDQDHDGFVDWPYRIDGTANSEDAYPLANPAVVPELNPEIVLLAGALAIVYLMRRKES